MYNNISLLVTEHCNLACTYCFERFKTDGLKVMSKEVADKALDFVFDNAVDCGEREVELTLFGGEPLLNPALCTHIIKSAYERGQRRNVQTAVAIVTNCTVFDEEVGKTVQEYADKMNFTIQLSIDGPKELHDRFRVKKDGTGSFDMILPVIEKWREMAGDRICVHPCLTKNNLAHMFEILCYFQDELHIPAVWMLPVCEEKWDADDVEIYRQQSGLVVDRILAQAKAENSFDPIGSVEPYNKVQNNLPPNADRKPCGVGYSFCTVSADGSLWPCHQLYYAEGNEHMKIGHLDTGVDEHKAKIYQKLDGTDIDCPSDCDHANCYRCPAINWQVYKTILTQKQDYYCEMMKVDQANLKRVKEEVVKMGLMEDQCRQHTPDTSQGCDVVVGRSGDDCDVVTRDRVVSDDAPEASFQDRLIALQKKKIAFDAAYIEQLHKLMG